jgi:hypothetical protein
VKGSFPGGCSGAGWTRVGCPRRKEVAGVEEGGGGGVRGSWCARQRKGREMGLVPSVGATRQKRKVRGAA